MNTRLEIASRILSSMVANSSVLAVEPDPNNMCLAALEFADGLIDHELRTRKPEPPLEKGVDTKP